MKKRALSLFFSLILVIAVSNSHAAGILTPKGSTTAPIEIRDHHVNIVINNGFATASASLSPSNCRTSSTANSIAVPGP